MRLRRLCLAAECRFRLRLSGHPAWRVAAVEISNEPAVSALGVRAERDGYGQLIVARWYIHNAKSLPDSLAC
jgi:hypothetical protein